MSLRILVVDDDAGIQSLARLSLERIGGFTVEICSCGADAVEKVRSFAPDAVILDVTMPGMDGPQTLKSLREVPQTASTPVIFMTANAGPHEVARYKEMGAVGAIAKPFDPMALPGILRGLLENTEEAGAGPGTRDSVGQRFAELKRSYMEEVPLKISRMKDAFSSLRDHWDRETLALFHRMAHNLAGSGGTFGLPMISEDARRLETLLKAALETAAPLNIGQLEETASVFAELVKSTERSLSEKHSAPDDPGATVLKSGFSSPADSRLIYLVEQDGPLARDLSSQIGYFGYTVRVFSRPEELREALAAALPAAIITGVVFSGDRYAGISVINEMRKALAMTVPVIFVSDLDDLDMRLRAVRAGGEAYFTKPLDISRLINKLDSLTRHQDFEPYRVLIVDDEPHLARYHALILEKSGMNTCVVTAPGGLIGALAEFRPELILMDVYMPECNGLELAKIIRQRESSVSIPIVFLSSETDVDKQLAAMNLGGDDFLTKPILPGHLSLAVTARLERSRALHSLMIRDSLTGLLNHSRTKEQMDIELSRAKRQNASLVFAIIDIDRFKSVNDTYGHFTGDQVIKGLSRLLSQRLRKTDTIGRYGGEEFALVLNDMNTANALQILDEIRSDFSKIRHDYQGKAFYVSFSCGVASFPPHDSCRSLIEEADKALYEAKGSGRNRVVLAGSCR